jgi:hypothetical protein
MLKEINIIASNSNSLEKKIFWGFFFCRLKILAPKKKVVLQEATTEAMKDSLHNVTINNCAQDSCP